MASDPRAINDHIRAKFAHVADWDRIERLLFAVPDDPHPNTTGQQALLAIEDRTIAAAAIVTHTDLTIGVA